jgi:hypothetical protein
MTNLNDGGNTINFDTVTGKFSTVMGSVDVAAKWDIEISFGDDNCMPLFEPSKLAVTLFLEF